METPQELKHAGAAIGRHASRILDAFDEAEGTTIPVIDLLDDADLEAFERTSGALAALVLIGSGGGIDERTLNQIARTIEFLAPMVDAIRREKNGESSD